MKNTLSQIADKLEILTGQPLNLGFKNGLTGISLFFFYYARFLQEERYEELAKESLEKVIADFPQFISYHLAHDFADVGRTVNFLANENFLEIEEDEFSGYFEDLLMFRLKEDLSVDFSFQTGMTGICDFFLLTGNEREAVNIFLGHLYSGLKVKGYPRHPVESIFLFPSEVWRDIKIFLLKLEKNNISLPQKDLLEHAIRKFEFKKRLRSNCPEYSILQDLREAEIKDDQQKINSALETIAADSSNLIFKGLALLSLENNSLPAWWKLI
jgi:hypothetical protein